MTTKQKLEIAEARLLGLYAAELAIESFIKESRAATQPYARRQGQKLEWWKGQFQGLVAAKAMLTLSDFPLHPDNKKRINQILRGKI